MAQAWRMEGPEQEASADTLYVCGIFNGLQACTVNELTDVDKRFCVA